MPTRVTVTVKNKRKGPDARELVQVMAKAAADYLGESLVNGYRPADGEARPRKGDGKPLGLDTGYLSRTIKPEAVHTTRAKASVRIRGPVSRQIFLAKNPDVLTLDGIVADEMDHAAREYLEGR